MSVPKRRHATSKSARHATPREAPERGNWLPDLGEAGRGKSRALVDALRNAIRHGGLADGECLPSQRTLAARAGVNTATVTKAIAEAARLGLVVTRPGGGTYVVGVRKAAASVPGASNGPIDLSLNIPPVELVKDMIDEALMALARRRAGDHLFGYAPLGGGARDRESGIAWMATRAVEATPDRTLVTNGAYEGLFAALTAVTRPGDSVLTESLNYTGVRRLGDLCRIHLVGIGVDDHGMRPDELDAACERHSPKAILTTPVTLNPTTATQDLQRRKALIAVAKRRSIIIIEDDIYGRLAGDETPPLAALSPDGVIYVTSLSKCVAPGLRVGYLHAPERVGIRARDALQLTSWTAPSLHAAIATEMIASGLAQACAHAHRAEALHRMALAHSVLRKGFVAGPAATYHGWLRLPNAWQEREATTAFHRHGVQVSPAHHFLLGGGDGPAAVRLSLGAVDRSTLERALHALAGVLRCARLRRARSCRPEKGVSTARFSVLGLSGNCTSTVPVQARPPAQLEPAGHIPPREGDRTMYFDNPSLAAKDAYVPGLTREWIAEVRNPARVMSPSWARPRIRSGPRPRRRGRQAAMKLDVLSGLDRARAAREDRGQIRLRADQVICGAGETEIISVDHPRLLRRRATRY